MHLERSAGVLSTSNIEVGEIARTSGFSSPQAFSKAFHIYFGCAPTEFRSLNRGKDCLLPGYLLIERTTQGLPKWVRIANDVGSFTTFVFAGPVLLAKVLPNGRIDWCPR